MATKNNLFSKARFTFVGTITYNKKDNAPVSDNPLKEGSKWNRKRLNIGVMDEAKNVGYLTMDYIYDPKNPTVKLFDAENKQHEVKIKDLALPSNVALVPDFSRIIIDLEEDMEVKKEYTKDIYALRNLVDKEEKTEEDLAKIEEHKKNIAEKATKRFECGHIDTAINIINEHLPELDKKKVRITGQVNVNYYNGKSRLEYVPSRIEIARPEEKSELTIDAKLFFMDGCVNDDEENKRATIVAYLGQRYKKADKIFPVSLILDYGKLDLENSLHAQMLDFLMKSFEVEDEENVMNMRFQLKVINSREEKEFDESCLTDQQKTMIALGMATIDDFKPRGNVFGDRIQEIRVIKPLLIDDYANGALIGFPLENLANYIVNEKDDESDIKQEDVKKEETDPVNQDLFGGLFG